MVLVLETMKGSKMVSPFVSFKNLVNIFRTRFSISYAPMILSSLSPMFLSSLRPVFYLPWEMQAQLESKLSTLYKELIKVSEHLTGRARTGQDAAASHMSSAVREREGTVVLRAGAMARDCASDLLSLSLLVPSAPWVRMSPCIVTDQTTQKVKRMILNLTIQNKVQIFVEDFFFFK